MIADGAHFQLYINDQLVKELDDTTFPGGSVGIVADVYDRGTQAVFEFRDFELRAN